jgi:hypothetical protein
MARINKSQTYAVRWLNSEGKNAEDIATELKLTVNQVNSVLEKNGTSEAKAEIKTAQQPATRIQKMLSSKTSGNKNVTVMTSEASVSIQDSTAKNKNSKKRSQDKYIYKPNG